MKTSLTKKEIEELLKSGSKINSENFSFFYKNKGDEKIKKHAIIVSKKIAKKSTERNKIRRVFRNCILKLKPNFDNFLILTKNSDIEYNEVLKEFETLLSKVKKDK